MEEGSARMKGLEVDPHGEVNAGHKSLLSLT